MKNLSKLVFSTYKGYIGDTKKSDNELSSSVQPLFPAGIEDNANTLRSQLSEAVGIQFQGEYQLIDVLNSELFTFGEYADNGSGKVYEAKYSINDSGVLGINWIAAREIEVNNIREMIENTGGLAPSGMPIETITNNRHISDNESIEPLFPNFK